MLLDFKNQDNMRKVIKELVNENSKEIKAVASSKVLITGAYLIIDPRNEGIVLSTDAKFHSTVRRNNSSCVLNST